MKIQVQLKENNTMPSSSSNSRPKIVIVLQDQESDVDIQVVNHSSKRETKWRRARTWCKRRAARLRRRAGIAVSYFILINFLFSNFSSS